ncbi:guanine nucleotide exchange factor C9orf72-like isoform X2 [Liolophura sinensis]|uniref:guanine nucleotide exchange factor C9orf72-like isoform X2 n=1 Tax=Liolophura sinensis TaxID=3198878 RepID=UPI003158DB6F
MMQSEANAQQPSGLTVPGHRANVQLPNGKINAIGTGNRPGLNDTSVKGQDTGTVAAGMATTPLSPSSSFTTSQLNSSQDLISAVCFSYWDNILGPRIQHTWYASNHQPLHNSTLLHICSQTLNGEICRDVATSHVDYKFYTMPDKDIVVAGFIFSAKNVYGLGVHSLALVIPHKEMSRYLEKHELIHRWIFRLTGKLKVLLNKDVAEKALRKFTAYLTNLMLMLSSLQGFGLPRKIEIKDTTFSPSHNIESEFIQKAIASHLITLGRSVVVGKTPERINLVISTLAMFNSPAERVCSRYVQKQVLLPYHQDLWLQGILVTSGDMLDIPTKEILCSKFPTTIVNITNRKILQSPPCNVHNLRHHETVKDELVCLHYGQTDEMTFPSMFQPADYPETYISRLTKEINLLHPACGVREAYIAQFMLFLHRKALALIKYVEAETNQGANSTKVHVKKLRADLNLTAEGDYRIVMAVAEKLKPGLYCYILGDRRHEAEQQINDNA